MIKRDYPHLYSNNEDYFEALVNRTTCPANKSLIPFKASPLMSLRVNYHSLAKSHNKSIHNIKKPL